MSKAFLKETDSSLDLDLNAQDDSDPSDSESSNSDFRSTKNYMTPLGAKKMQNELHHLLNIERPEVVRTVAWAASNGDRSENGDYIYGKKRLREIDRRIRFLTKRLDRAEIVDPLAQSGDRILFGATVEIVDLEDDEADVKKYSIVGIDETDVKRGLISWISPLAKALLQNKKGDAISLQTPQGQKEYEILSVRYSLIEIDPLAFPRR